MYLQLQKFRNLKGHGGYPISNNYRPTQMLHGRVVNLYDKYGISIFIPLPSVLCSWHAETWRNSS